MDGLGALQSLCLKKAGPHPNAYLERRSFSSVYDARGL
jgi:hypothetical protein